jgi:hypothetical protein
MPAEGAEGGGERQRAQLGRSGGGGRRRAQLGREEGGRCAGRRAAARTAGEGGA